MIVSMNIIEIIITLDDDDQNCYERALKTYQQSAVVNQALQQNLGKNEKNNKGK